VLAALKHLALLSFQISQATRAHIELAPSLSSNSDLRSMNALILEEGVYAPMHFNILLTVSRRFGPWTSS